MPVTTNPLALETAFLAARTFNKFTDRPVEDQTLKELYDLLKWGPTSMNCQPARFVFVKSKEAKDKLAPTLAESNLKKTMAAPVTVIIAQDTEFYEFLPSQFPAYDAKPGFVKDPELAKNTAFRNGTLQGAYLIIAARLLGLDVGPMSGFDAEKLNKAFFPNGRWKANFIANLGYGDPSGNHPRGPRLEFSQAAKIL